jgi:isopenicillin N synthase-like dioxygenase
MNKPLLPHRIAGAEALRIAEEILRLGFAELAIDPSILAQHVPSITEGMQRMTEDPAAHAAFPEIIVSVDEMGWPREAGLVRRNDAENKYFFHHQTPEAEWPDEEKAKEYVHFLESCKALGQEAQRIVLAVAEALDTIGCGADGKLVEMFTNANVVIRILRYLQLGEERAGNADAYAHMDRSGFTVQFWASEIGLKIFDRERNSYRVDETAWDKVALFVGKKLFGVTHGSQGMIGVHGVRDAREGRPAKKDRYAIIAFIHPKMSKTAVDELQARMPDIKAFEHSCVP